MKLETRLLRRFLLALATVAALSACQTAKPPAPAPAPAVQLAATMPIIPAQATVRAIHGSATWSTNGAEAQPLQPTMTLPEGAVIETGADTTVDLQVNGRTSVLRLTSNSKVELKTINASGEDSETLIDVTIGQVLGFVKKISKDSKYEVNTPRGVAAIRGTDFSVTVKLNADGSYNTTFTSITGQVFVTANVNIKGTPTEIPLTLTSGQSWTPPQSAASKTEAVQIQTLPAYIIFQAYQGSESPIRVLVYSGPEAPLPAAASGTPGAPGGALPDLMQVYVPADPSLPSCTGTPPPKNPQPSPNPNPLPFPIRPTPVPIPTSRH